MLQPKKIKETSSKPESITTPAKDTTAAVPTRGIVDCTYRHGHNGQILNLVQNDILKKCRLLVGMPFACVQEHTSRWWVLQAGMCLIAGVYCSYSLEFVSSRDMQSKPSFVVPGTFQPDRYLRIAQAKSNSETIDIIGFLTFE